eukprot:COSAG06_NODE_1041_length_10982_cov_6.205366_14_plen_91_part_00
MALVRLCRPILAPRWRRAKGFCGAFPVRKPFERLDFANVAWTPDALQAGCCQTCLALQRQSAARRRTTAQLSETKGGPVRLRCTALMHRS